MAEGFGVVFNNMIKKACAPCTISRISIFLRLKMSRVFALFIHHKMLSESHSPSALQITFFFTLKY